MNPAEHIVFLSLGSNTGNRLYHLRKATEAIGEIACVMKISSVYETSPVGPIPQNHFLNAAMKIQTTLAPQDLMLHLMQIEESHGRKREIKWGPRNIDIDILFYDDRILNAAGLVIPHPHYADRKFVIEPLYEIAPQWRCPVRNKTIAEIRRSLTDGHTVQKIKDNIAIEFTEEMN